MVNRYTAALTGLIIAVSAPGWAQNPTPAKPAHYTTNDTPIGTLLADPAAKAVLDRDIPDMSSNSSIGMVSSMTLRAIAPMSPDKLSDKTLDQVDADLAKLPAK